MTLRLSGLPKSWLIDIDGVALRHNGYKKGMDELLCGVKEFWNKIPKSDIIILLSARHNRFKRKTLAVFKSQNLRYDMAIFGIPVGERICINDVKPSGLKTCYAINLKRNAGLSKLRIIIDKNL